MSVKPDVDDLLARRRGARKSELYHMRISPGDKQDIRRVASYLGVTVPEYLLMVHRRELKRLVGIGDIELADSTVRRGGVARHREASGDAHNGSLEKGRNYERRRKNPRRQPGAENK